MYIELDDYATNRVMNNFDPETQVILFAWKMVLAHTMTH